MKRGLLGFATAVFVILAFFYIVSAFPTPAPIVESNKIHPYSIKVSSKDGKEDDFYGESRQRDPILIGQDLGVVIYPEDKTLAIPNIDIAIGASISVIRAPEININDWGKDKLYRSFAPTIEELFVEKNIELGKDDKVSQSLEMPIYSGIKIKITRVAVTEVVVNQPIDFKTIVKDDPQLDEGKTRIERAGKKGVLAKTFRVTRENGMEVSRVLIKSETTTQPTDQIQFRGTRPVITVACKYNSTVIAAATKYKYSANKICNLMMYESMGRADAVNPNGHYGLFQYEPGAFAADASNAGYAGANIFDPTGQIYAATWALTHGKAWRW